MKQAGDLFDAIEAAGPCVEPLAEGAAILRRFAIPEATALLDAVRDLTGISPFRHLETPGGRRMSVAMSNCGPLGWVSDRRGYRYEAIDPLTARPWPMLPESFLRLASRAAAQAGFTDYVPDACLINRYEPGTQLTLHQDRDERDAHSPIVSVSLGLPAIFLFGGAVRTERPRRFRLAHGDVVVWGGASRFAFHGVAPIADGEHPATGRTRINLTFRKAR